LKEFELGLDSGNAGGAGFLCEESEIRKMSVRRKLFNPVRGDILVAQGVNPGFIDHDETCQARIKAGDAIL